MYAHVLNSLSLDGSNSPFPPSCLQCYCLRIHCVTTCLSIVMSDSVDFWFIYIRSLNWGPCWRLQIVDSLLSVVWSVIAWNWSPVPGKRFVHTLQQVKNIADLWFQYFIWCFKETLPKPPDLRRLYLGSQVCFSLATKCKPTQIRWLYHCYYWHLFKFFFPVDSEIGSLNRHPSNSPWIFNVIFITCSSPWRATSVIGPNYSDLPVGSNSHD